MPGSGKFISPTVQKFWSIVYGKSAPPPPPVVIHDPAAKQAHDLDDPFFDNNVQKRMGDVIAAANQDKDSKP